MQKVAGRSAVVESNVVDLAATGNVSLVDKALKGTTHAIGATGMLANVPFRNLAVDAGYGGSQVTLNSLTLNAFAGSIDAAGRFM